MADETSSLRDTLSTAYDAQVSEASSTPAPEPVVQTKTEAPAPVEKTSTAAERARDEAGRFAKKPETAATEPPKPGAETKTAPVTAEVKPAEVAPEKPPEPPKYKPPQSWKATTREKWAALPPEVQEEVNRRELETTKVLNETAQVRQFAQSVQQSLAPYETIARANGMDAMTWAGTALQTVAALYAGTPQQKAQVIAQAIATSGIDVDAINAAMQNPQAAPARQAPAFNPEVAVEKVIEQRLQKIQAQRAEQEARAFIESAPEFLDDVKEDVIEILRLAESRGQQITYQQAYDRAVRYNEGVQKVLEQRKASTAAKAQAEAAQKSQAAAVSVKNSPVASSPAKPKGIRSALEAAYDAQFSR